MRSKQASCSFSQILEAEHQPPLGLVIRRQRGGGGGPNRTGGAPQGPPPRTGPGTPGG